MFVQAATLDFIYGHAFQLVTRARQQCQGEGKWELDVHVDIPHDFSMFPAWLVPYSKVAVSRVAEFIAQHALRIPSHGL